MTWRLFGWMRDRRRLERAQQEHREVEQRTEHVEQRAQRAEKRLADGTFSERWTRAFGGHT